MATKVFSYAHTILRVPFYMALLIQTACSTRIKYKPQYQLLHNKEIDEANFSLKKVIEEWKELGLKTTTLRNLEKPLQDISRKDQLTLYKIFSPLKPDRQKKFLKALAEEKEKNIIKIAKAILFMNIKERGKELIEKICCGKNLTKSERAYLAIILGSKGYFSVMKSFHKRLKDKWKEL